MSALRRWFVVADSLFIVAPIVCGGSVFGPCFVMQNLVPFLVLQWGRERERADKCFTLIVFLVVLCG